MEKGERQHSQDLDLSSDACQELQTLQCDPRWKQEEAEARTALESPNTPTRETRNKTDSTEKVERLRDNPGGLSVVIYNRDCKMVSQI